MTTDPGAVPPSRSPIRATRRQFLRIALGAGAVAAVGGSSSLYGFTVEPFRPVIERVTLRSPRVPRALNGLTIGQITDTHFGPVIRQEHVERAAALLMSLRPDLIALTGDYVHGMSDPRAIEALRALEAPLGIYAIWGNHDQGGVKRQLRAAFAAVMAGRLFALLENRSTVVNVRGTLLHLVGVDDVMAGLDDLPAALAGVPRDATAILLAHEPDFADDAAAAFPFVMQISGHSHGGQVRLPLLGALFLPQLARKYQAGLVAAGDMPLYVSRGVGVINPPVRLNCPPEVTLLTLRSA